MASSVTLIRRHILWCLIWVFTVCSDYYGIFSSCDFFLVQIGPARYRAPEVLFKPDLIGEECEGIHQILTFSIQKSDMDLRRTLFSNIVLSGGSTLFKGKYGCCR